MTRKEVIVEVQSAVRRAMDGWKYGSLYSNFHLDENLDIRKAVKDFDDIFEVVVFADEFFLNYAHADEFANLSWEEAKERLYLMLKSLAEEAGIEKITMAELNGDRVNDDDIRQKDGV
ncbi:MAG: hypothetical protein J0H02_02995 [Armatimonadetes bacterium]|nr:hypothetical protein [Armatimonadota bacterium]